jgi:hypothetical protein
MTHTRRSILAGLLGGAISAHGQNVPQLTLGVPTDLPGIEFSRISDARELPDGRLIVTDAIDKQVSVVDFARRTSRKIGRQGAGPGEYRTPGRLLQIGADSTLVVDLLGGRWLVMARDSIVDVVPGSAPAMAGGRNPLGADSHGHLLASRIARSLDGAIGNVQIANDSSWLMRVDRHTGKLDTVGKFRVRPSRIAIKGTSEQPTSVSVVMNPISTGELPVMFADGAIGIARLDPYRVDWIIGGKTVAGARLPFETVPVSHDEKVAALTRIGRVDPNAPKDPDEVKDWPEAFPPFLTGAAQPAPDGTLWIKRAASAKAPGTDYDVVDRTGRLVKRVHLPTNEGIVSVGRSALYVIVTDDDDVQHLRRYALSK